MEAITQPPHDQYYFARISSPTALLEKFPSGSTVKFTSEMAKGQGRIVGFVRAPKGSYQHAALVGLEGEIQWSLSVDQYIKQYPVISVPIFTMCQTCHSLCHWSLNSGGTRVDVVH